MLSKAESPRQTVTKADLTTAEKAPEPSERWCLEQ
jgi:hypothetical protein